MSRIKIACGVVVSSLAAVLVLIAVDACQPPNECTEQKERACLAEWLECETAGLPACEPLYCDCLSRAGCEGSTGWLMVCEEDPPDG